MDSLPPSPPSAVAQNAPAAPSAPSAAAPGASPAAAPSTPTAAPPTVDSRVAAGDIYPRSSRERSLCSAASHPDWLYLGGLIALDAVAIGVGSSESIKYADNVPVRLTGPAMIGLTWGATVGGWWLALPKCSPEWVGETPSEGTDRATWPLALSLSLLAGATAPIVNAVAIGYTLPANWSTFEREMHLVVAGVAGFGGALLPYLLPPKTWAAARELDKLRFDVDGRGAAFVTYAARF